MLVGWIGAGEMEGITLEKGEVLEKGGEGVRGMGEEVDLGGIMGVWEGGRERKRLLGD